MPKAWKNKGKTWSDPNKEEKPLKKKDIPKWLIIDEEDVLKIARDLVDKHHNKRCMVQFKDIGFLWNMKGFSGSVAGKCSLVSDAYRTFFKNPVHFVVQLDFPKFQDLTPDQQVAIIDHELCHIDYNEDEKTGDLKPKIRTRDSEEFCEIVDRHGAWTPALQLMEKILARKKER